jgi:TetR/AcrR family transcriptional regulator, cholesterol catabolism regulator
MSSLLPLDRGPRGALSRQRILDNAARLFRANGYAATSLGDIAAASGMRTASLYYHFASKEALVAAMLQISAERTSAAAAAAVAALPVNAPFAARLAAAIAAHLEQLLGHADYTSADLRIINQVPESVRRAVLPIRQDYARWWQSLLEEGRRTGAVRPDCDLKLVRMLLLGALNWASEWYKPDRGPVAPIARECARLVVEGIATTVSDRRAVRRRPSQAMPRPAAAAVTHHRHRDD